MLTDEKKHDWYVHMVLDVSIHSTKTYPRCLPKVKSRFTAMYYDIYRQWTHDSLISFCYSYPMLPSPRSTSKIHNFNK